MWWWQENKERRVGSYSSEWAAGVHLSSPDRLMKCLYRSYSCVLRVVKERRVKRCRWKWEGVKLRKWRMWWASETSRSRRLNQCCRKCALLRLNHSFLCHVWLLSNNSMTSWKDFEWYWGSPVNFKGRFKDFKWQKTFSAFWSSWNLERWNLSLWFAFFRDLISCRLNLSLQDLFRSIVSHCWLSADMESSLSMLTLWWTLSWTIQLICVTPQCQYRSVRREGGRCKIPLQSTHFQLYPITSNLFQIYLPTTLLL